MKRFPKTISALTMVILAMLQIGCGNTSTQPVSGGTQTGITATGKTPSKQPHLTPKTQDGTTAVPVDTKTDYVGKSVYFLNPEQGWIGGTGFIFHTTDGGQTWQVQLTGNYDVSVISFINSEDGWAVAGAGQQPSVSDKPVLLRTTDGGTHWNEVSNLTTPVEDIRFVSPDVGFAGNEITHDGGTTWSPIPVPAGITGNAFFTNTTTGWAVTDNGGKFEIQSTTDGGHTWMTSYVRPFQYPITDSRIESNGSGDIWAMVIGGSGMSQTSYSIFHTMDAGAEWTPVIAHSTAGGGPAPGVSASSSVFGGLGSKPGELFVLNPRTAFIIQTCPACKEGTVSTAGTLDGGKTWLGSTDQLSGQDGHISFVDDKHGWLLTERLLKASVLYETTDGGTTWKQEFVFGTHKAG